MSSIQLKKRKIETKLILGNDGFAEGGNVKTYRNLATTFRMQREGFPSLTRTTIEIHNLRLDDAERITTIGPRLLQLGRNFVQVAAGDEDNVDDVFKGEIFEAYPIIEGADRYMLRIRAMEGIIPQITPEPVRTIEGRISGLTLLNEYAEKMGYSLYVDGVDDAFLEDVALSGSLMSKANQIATHMGVEIILENSVLYVKPRGRPLTVVPIVTVNSDTGIVGYPTPTSNGIAFVHLFSNKFRQGGIVEIDRSLITKTIGRFSVYKVSAYLQSEGAGQNWLSAVEAMKYSA